MAAAAETAQAFLSKSTGQVMEALSQATDALALDSSASSPGQSRLPSFERFQVQMSGR